MSADRQPRKGYHRRECRSDTYCRNALPCPRQLSRHYYCQRAVDQGAEAGMAARVDEIRANRTRKEIDLQRRRAAEAECQRSTPWHDSLGASNSHEPEQYGHRKRHQHCQIAEIGYFIHGGSPMASSSGVEAEAAGTSRRGLAVAIVERNQLFEP